MPAETPDAAGPAEPKASRKAKAEAARAAQAEAILEAIEKHRSRAGDLVAIAEQVVSTQVSAAVTREFPTGRRRSEPEVCAEERIVLLELISEAAHRAAAAEFVAMRETTPRGALTERLVRMAGLLRMRSVQGVTFRFDREARNPRSNAAGRA